MLFLQITSSPNSLRLTLPETNSSHLQPSFQCGRLRVETRLRQGAFQHQNRGKFEQTMGNKNPQSFPISFFFPLSIVAFLEFPQKLLLFFHISGYKTITYILSFMFLLFGGNVVVPLGKIKVWST